MSGYMCGKCGAALVDYHADDREEVAALRSEADRLTVELRRISPTADAETWRLAFGKAEARVGVLEGALRLFLRWEETVDPTGGIASDIKFARRALEGDK